MSRTEESPMYASLFRSNNSNPRTSFICLNHNGISSSKLQDEQIAPSQGSSVYSLGIRMLYAHLIHPRVHKFGSPVWSRTAAYLLPLLGQIPVVQGRNGQQRRLKTIDGPNSLHGRRNWSHAEYEQVVALRRKGSSFRKIAALTGRNHSSVARLLKNNGNRFLRNETTTERRYWSPEEDKRLKELRARKVRFRDIAGQFQGRTLESLKHRWKDMRNYKASSIPTSRQIWSDSEEALLRRLGIELNLSAREIHDRMTHRTRHAIQQKLLALRGGLKAKSSNYTEDDDALIAGLKAAGKRWHEMVEHLPGRSSAAIAAHYYYIKNK